MTDKNIEIEAAAFRRLVKHLQERTDVQNIDLMNLSQLPSAGIVKRQKTWAQAWIWIQQKKWFTACLMRNGKTNIKPKPRLNKKPPLTKALHTNRK